MSPVAPASEAQTAKPSTYPTPSSEGRSRNMRAIRRVDTKPEAALRSALHRAGRRFRKDLRIELVGLRVRPDIVFTRLRVAVFVDGCFWHVCPDHGREPRSNADYWSPKLRGNVERDRAQTKALELEGWRVVRIWQHTPAPEAVGMVEAVLAELDGRVRL